MALSHKSTTKRLCEVSNHFADNLILHVLDTSSHLKYDYSIKEKIDVIIIEKGDV